MVCCHQDVSSYIEIEAEILSIPCITFHRAIKEIAEREEEDVKHVKLE